MTNRELNPLESGGPMDQNYTSRTKYDLVTGKEYDGRLLETKRVGDAFKYEGSHYYILDIWGKGLPYYLVPNRDQETRYTLFEKKIDCEEKGRPIFQRPIGRAWIPEGLRTHLHLYTNFSREHAYMCLFPESA